MRHVVGRGSSARETSALPMIPHGSVSISLVKINDTRAFSTEVLVCMIWVILTDVIVMPTAVIQVWSVSHILVED